MRATPILLSILLFSCGVATVGPGLSDENAACGDGTCDPGETCSTCADDCGACSASCGNGTCGEGESCSSCPADCGTCATPTCGDGTCGSGESCSICPADCGSCSGPLPGNLNEPTGMMVLADRPFNGP